MRCVTARKPVDWWSALHFTAGCVLCFLYVPWYGMLALAVGYEGLEAATRRNRTHKGGIFEGESWVNIVADVVVACLGWAATWGVLWWLKRPLP